MKKKVLILISIIALVSTSLFASSFGLGVISGYENEYLKYNGDDISIKLDEGTANVPVHATMQFNIGSHFAFSLNGGANIYLPEQEGEDPKVGAGADLALYFRAPVGSVFDFNIGVGAGYKYLKLDSISTNLPIIGTITGDTSIHTIDVYATLRPVFNLGEHWSFFADGKVGLDVLKQFNGKTNVGVAVNKNLLEDDVLGWKWSAQAGLLYRF